MCDIARPFLCLGGSNADAAKRVAVLKTATNSYIQFIEYVKLNRSTSPVLEVVKWGCKSASNREPLPLWW